MRSETTQNKLDVLVTGSARYIGSVLLAILRDTDKIATVTVLDDFSASSPRNLLHAGLAEDNHLQFCHDDVTAYGDIESAIRGCDTVIHLAAITGAANTHDRQEETFYVNCGGIKKCTAHCR